MKNTIHMLSSVRDTICNSFIITTEDGKIIVIDGGYPFETDHFLENLKRITGSDKPHIDAWFLSHPHDDHVSVFLEIAENRSSEVEFDVVYLNFPSQGFLAREDESAEQTMKDFYRVLPHFADKMRILSGGDTLDIGAAHFTVLYSHDFEINRNVCNNASLVFRMDLGGRSVMFTGDCGVEAGRKVVRLWKDSGLLDCEICQMAHHGQNGCDRDFYEAVSPEICLWPTPTWLWNNDAGKGYNTHSWQTIVVQGWMNELGVRENYIMKDGTQVLEL